MPRSVPGIAWSFLCVVIAVSVANFAGTAAATNGWPVFVDHSFATSDGAPWDPFQTVRAAPSRREAPAFVDWTGDGVVDLVVARDGFSSPPGVRWYKNAGTNAAPVYELDANASSWFPTGSGATGADPQALSFGDMDGDGLQDAFLTKWDWYTGSHISNPTLSFRSNRVSTGLAPRGFSDPPTALETTMQAFLDKLAQPGFIRPVDFDQDGDLDVALLEYPCCGDVKETKVHLFVNRGSASAPVLDGGAPDMSVEVEGTAFMLDVVDLNTDGLLDLVYGSSSGIHVYMHAPPPHKVPPSQALPFLNVSSASFVVVGRASPFEGLEYGKAAFMPAFHDVDGDGDMDVLVGNENSASLSLRFFRNTGTLGRPSFVPDPRLPCGDLCNRTWGTPRLVAVNADADAEAELLVLDEDGRMHWFDRQPSRNFVEAPGLQAWTRHLHIDPRLRYVMVDMTNDGRVDALGLALGASPAIVVFADAGTDSEPWLLKIVEVAVPAAAVVGIQTTVYAVDVTEDGLVDLVVGAGLVAVNTGTTSKPAFGKGLTKEELPAGVVALLSDTTIAGADVAGAFVDMDGDGDLDFIHGLDGSTFSYFNNTGSWTFVELVGDANPLADALQFTDVTGVGARESPTVPGVVEIVQVDGQAASQLAYGTYDIALQRATFDTPKGIACNGLRSATPYLADVHGNDTVLDILILCVRDDVSSYGRAMLAHVERTANGDLSQRSETQALWAGRLGINPRTAVAVADVDADGDVDVLFGDEQGIVLVSHTESDASAAARLRVFSIQDAVRLGSDDTTYAKLAIADVNGDGLLDIVRGYSLSGTDRRPQLFMNVGNATHPQWDAGWTMGANPQGTIEPSPLVMDVNGDGKPEACAVDAFGVVSVWVSQPDTQLFGQSADLSTRMAGTPKVKQPTFAPYDLDGDGDLDILVAGSGRVQAVVNTAVECFPQCNGHGVCVDTAAMTVLAPLTTCSCQSGFTGAQCDQCNDGFYGLECTQRCPSVTTEPCSGHGVCDSGIYGSGTCTCDVGYTGADCNVGGCVPGSGYVVPEGSSVGTCELCEAGRYKSLSLNAPCIECPAGKYTNATGATHCDACPAGTFQGLAGRTSCISCALGTATNTTGQTSCDLCSAGTYSSSPGSLTCDACPLGTFTPCSNSFQCNNCTTGHFANTTGLSECLACAPGYHVNSTGAQSCEKCPRGTQNAAVGQADCFPCKPGLYADQDGSTGCTRCPVGKYGDQHAMSECTPCPEGHFASQRGLTACEPCPEGFFANTTGSDSCYKCPEKSQSQPGSASCVECLRGEVQPQGSRSCLACRAGSYSWIPGEPITADCHVCPANAYCAGYDHMVARLGYWRSSPDSIIFHKCARSESCQGYQAGDVANETDSMRIAAARRVASAASVAAAAADDASRRLATSGGETAVADEACDVGYIGPLCLVCDEGYGRSGASSCGKCRDETLFVLGGAFAFGVVIVSFLVWKQMRAGDQLEAKLLDIQERVAAARRRSHKHGSGSGSGQATPHTTMSTTGTSTVADAAEAKERLQHLRDYQTKDVLDARTLRLAVMDPEQNIEAAIVKVLMNNLQVLALAASFELSWPEWLASLFDMQDSTSSASGSVFSLDCVLDDHDHVPAIFQEIMLFTAGPLILFALAALFWFCVHPRLYRQHVHRHRQQHETRVKQLAQHGKHVHDADAELKRLKRHWAANPKGHRVERFTVTVIIIFFLLQNSVLKKGFALFACAELDPGMYVLVGAMDYTCFSSEHWLYMWTVGVFNLGFYAFGVPLLVLYMLFKRRHRLQDVDMLAKFGFLTMGYEPQYWFYEIVVMARKISVLAVVAFLGRVDVQVQTLLGILIIVAALVAQTHLSPYEARTLDHLESLGLGTSAITLYGGLFLSHDKITSTQKVIISFFIAACNVSYMVYGAYLIFNQVRTRVQRAIRAMQAKCARRRGCQCCVRTCCPNAGADLGDTHPVFLRQDTVSRIVPSSKRSMKPAVNAVLASDAEAWGVPAPTSIDMLGSRADVLMQPVDITLDDGEEADAKQHPHRSSARSQALHSGSGHQHGARRSGSGAVELGNLPGSQMLDTSEPSENRSRSTTRSGSRLTSSSGSDSDSSSSRTSQGRGTPSQRRLRKDMFKMFGSSRSLLDRTASSGMPTPPKPYRG